MSKLNKWVKAFIAFSKTVNQMVQFLWQANSIVFVAILTVQIAQGLVPVLTAWIIKEIFDLLTEAFRIESKTFLIQSLLPLLILQAGINLLTLFFGQFVTYLQSEMGRKLHLTTQTSIYKRLATLEGLRYFENPEFHDTLRLASYGLYRGPAQVLKTFSEIIRSIITLLSFLSILIYLSPFLAFLVTIGSLPQLVIQLKIGQERFGLMYINSPKERKIDYLRQLFTNLNFVKELRLFNTSKYFVAEFTNLTKQVQSTQRRQEIREIRRQLFLSLVASGVSSVAFIIVIMQAFEGNITLGDVTLYTSAFTAIQIAIFGIIHAIGDLNENYIFFKRFNELMDLPPGLYVSQNPRPIPRLKIGIEFKGVSFRYTEDQPWVLSDVNLFFPHGKCLALVGLNGAGKTTLVKLLTRLYDPTKGQILWDGIDIREFDVRELRQLMGVIFQDFVKYDLTVQENIGLGNIKEIDNLSVIEEVAKKVKVHNFIKDLPNGYQTILSRWLSENQEGTDLSGGQWQKIATARMFMRDSDFLILDEPTSALDAESEYEVYKQFTTLVKDRTSLLISHRFSTVQIAELVAVLENGEIIEYGTHSELLSNEKTYARLYKLQSSQYDPHK